MHDPTAAGRPPGERSCIMSESVVITFENLQRLFSEPHIFTHEWATQCVMCLQNVTERLARKRQQIDWLRHSIHELLIGRCVFEVANFDFGHFSLSTEKPVEVFGQFFETYHAATRDLFIQVFDAVFRVIVPRGNEITEADVERFSSRNTSQVADAVWKTTGLAANELQDKLKWLLAALDNEAQRAREIHCIAQAASTPAPIIDKGTADSDLVLVPLQQNILLALDGKALKKQPLADIVCAGEGTRLYRKNGIKELMTIGRVAHKNGVGYYRPDAPPAGLIVPR
jgi:hypothetical protein